MSTEIRREALRARTEAHLREAEALQRDTHFLWLDDGLPRLSPAREHAYMCVAAARHLAQCVGEE